MRNKNNILFDVAASKRIKVLSHDVLAFYSKEFPEIKIKSQWEKVRCCFHVDSNPSLSINLISGGFHCFACGAKGGDIISFIMKRYHMTFKETCRYLGVSV